MLGALLMRGPGLRLPREPQAALSQKGAHFQLMKIRLVSFQTSTVDGLLSTKAIFRFETAARIKESFEDIFGFAWVLSRPDSWTNCICRKTVESGKASNSLAGTIYLP